MLSISVRELKARLSEHLRRIERGESLTVTKRGKPVAVLSPAGGRAAVSEQQRREAKLRALAEKGVLLQWSPRKPKVPARGVKLRGDGPTISEMVLHDRR